MLKKLQFASRGALPRLLLLDHVDEQGEPRAAVIHPGRLPVIYPNLVQALDALRVETVA